MSALETQTERQWLELSLAQRAVWLDASLSDDPTAYTLVRVVRMKGAFDPEAARQALTLVTARHDALRLRADSELPRQWLHGSSEAAFTLVDLSAEPDPERAARARIARTLATPLPLGDRSLFALELLALAPREWRAVIRCHHLLADEAGLSMILHHWLSAYRALTSDGPAELAPPSSYVAEIAADVAYAESERYRADLDYWTGRFKSLSPQLLQPQGASATAPSRAPHVVKWTVEGALFERFSAAAKKAGVTPQRALIASLAIVLSRRYGPADVTLGLALHRRTASNAHVVGMLAGAIAVRCRLSGIATFRETARELSAQIDRDLRHQRLPVDALARELGISQSGLAGLFQVAFSYLPFVGALDIALDDLTFEVEHLPSSEASPLTLHAYELESGRGLLLDVAAHPGFIDEAEARRIASLLQAALVRFVEEPDAELERFAGTTEAERLEVVTTRNATAAAFPQGTADHFFDRSAQAAPGAPAVVSETEALGYAELDARSNQLARRLLARGLAPQTVVGVALERSVSTVVSLLAILKAGCVY
ncbi:MAG: condensation domain-containing protein, partial [Candidatus Baltobacteraceae bacterium]